MFADRAMPRDWPFPNKAGVRFRTGVFGKSQNLVCIAVLWHVTTLS